MTLGPFATAIDEAQPYWMLNGLLTIIARGEQTGGAYGLVELVLNKAAEPPPHVHHREDEAFYVLDGEMTVRVGEETLHAAPGGLVFCPRGVPHRLVIDSAEARVLVLVTPAGLEWFWRELGEPAPTRALPEPREPDQDRLLRLVAEYGMELLPSWP